MTRVDELCVTLRKLPGANASAWDTYLRHNSRLPGPRVNLELLEAAVIEGDETKFRHWRELDAGHEDMPDEFVLMCGIAGLGRVLGETFDVRRHAPAGMVRELRKYANDRRGRVRDAVASALHRVGDVHLRPLLEIAETWAAGNPVECSTGVAGVAEERFVVPAVHANERIFDILDRATAALVAETNRRAPPADALRRVLSYGWAVAVTADPEGGVARFDRWVGSHDPDVRRAVRDNLENVRLRRRLPAAVQRWDGLVGN